MPRTALFVIDIQHALAGNPTTSIPHAARIQSTGTALLARARSAIDSARSNSEEPSLEIVIVQHEETPEKGDLQRGSKQWDLVFPPREGHGNETVISKDVRGDAFSSNPELASRLREKGVDTIVAFGIQSECCVLSTCRGALAAGFKVMLLSGAHSTYDDGGRTAEEIEKEVEDELVREGVRVVEWETWMA